MQAVLLAGGKGTRLRPYTEHIPKPLVPLGDMPVIELLVTQLREARVDALTVVTGHLADMIEDFLGDGQRFGLTIRYFREETPLDTAGCLGLIPRPDRPFLMMNGDLLTSLDFRRMMQFHRQHGAIASIAAHRREVKIDLGVIVTGDDGSLVDYVEKPTYDFWVSMGVYCFEPRVCDFVTPGERLTLPDLMLRLRDAGETIHSFREECYWLDIGRPDDYARAIEDFQRSRHLFFRGREAA